MNEPSLEIKKAGLARAAHLGSLISGLAGGAATVNRVFGYDQSLANVLFEIAAVDMSFGALDIDGGLFRADAHSPSRVVELFASKCVLGWTIEHRPSLPAIAQGMLEHMGITPEALLSGQGLSQEEHALAKAIMLTALRGEYIRGLAPSPTRKNLLNAYHNALHTAHVAIITNYLAQLHNELAAKNGGQKLSRADHLCVVLSAFAHDVDHPGKSNPKQSPLENEHAAFEAVRPILTGCAVPRARIHEVLTMLRTTSPDGPHKFLKEISCEKRAANSQQAPDIDTDAKFTDLDHLAGNAKLTELAAILSDADLFASSGAGLEVNKIMSQRLTREVNESGGNVDFTGDHARANFLKYVVGEDGYCSLAGREAFNQFFYDLKTYTEMRLKMGRGEMRPDY